MARRGYRSSRPRRSPGQREISPGKRSPRRVPPVVEPRAVFAHARPLLRGRMPPTGNVLVRPLGGAPACLDAIVRVVSHLEGGLARQEVGDAERPRTAVAARIADGAFAHALRVQPFDSGTGAFRSRAGEDVEIGMANDALGQ